MHTTCFSATVPRNVCCIQLLCLSVLSKSFIHRHLLHPTCISSTWGTWVQDKYASTPRKTVATLTKFWTRGNSGVCLVLTRKKSQRIGEITLKGQNCQIIDLIFHCRKFVFAPRCRGVAAKRDNNNNHMMAHEKSTLASETLTLDRYRTAVLSCYRTGSVMPRHACHICIASGGSFSLM